MEVEEGPELTWLKATKQMQRSSPSQVGRLVGLFKQGRFSSASSVPPQLANFLEELRQPFGNE
jgi:hypothetical protein